MLMTNASTERQIAQPAFIHNSGAQAKGTCVKYLRQAVKSAGNINDEHFRLAEFTYFARRAKELIGKRNA